MRLSQPQVADSLNALVGHSFSLFEVLSSQPTDFPSGEDERYPDSGPERTPDQVKMKITRSRTGTAEVSNNSKEDDPCAQ